MVQINFNAQGVAPNAALDVLPSGVYDVIITNSQEKPTKSSTPTNPKSFIEFEMTIRSPDPQLNNRKVFDRLNIKNDNQQAVDIAYATLSAICHVTGRYQIADTQQLHGIPFKAVVAKVERTDRPGEFSNEVKGYKDMNGNDPGTPGAGMGGQGQGAPQGTYGGAPGGGAPGGGAPGGGYAGQGAPNGGYPQGNGGGYPQGAPQGQGPGNGGYPQPGQHSDQHQLNQPGNGQGAPQGNGQQQPPAWAGGGAPQGGDPQQGHGAPQGGGAPQGMPQGQPQHTGAPQGMPQGGGQPGPGDVPPWARPQ